MNTAGMLAEVFRRYGQTVTLRPGAGASRRVKAFVQPILEQQRQEVPTPIGRRDRGKFLYLAAPEGALTGVETVELAGEQYRVRTARPIRVGDGISHWWGVLELKDREVGA